MVFHNYSHRGNCKIMVLFHQFQVLTKHLLYFILYKLFYKVKKPLTNYDVYNLSRTGIFVTVDFTLLNNNEKYWNNKLNT